MRYQDRDSNVSDAFISGCIWELAEEFISVRVVERKFIVYTFNVRLQGRAFITCSRYGIYNFTRW